MLLVQSLFNEKYFYFVMWCYHRFFLEGDKFLVTWPITMQQWNLSHVIIACLILWINKPNSCNPLWVTQSTSLVKNYVHKHILDIFDSEFFFYPQIKIEDKIYLSFVVLFKHLYLFLPFNNFFKSAYTKRNEKNKKKLSYSVYTKCTCL